MKVCPNCQSRYDQGEAFCPSDGTKLVDAKELSPGQLTGKELGGVVHLDALNRSDAMGERYDGQLLDSERGVLVTVFNQESSPKPHHAEHVRAAADLLRAAIPPEIIALHSYDLDSADFGFVVEDAVDGRSLREILQDDGKLPWQTAVRITAHLAQALHWMAERGHIHRGIHPGAIYITDLEEGEVQIGDWIQSALTYHPNPLEEAEDGSDFIGFGAYMSPEAIREEGRLDERSLVYSLGMLLYEMVLGKPPFTSTDPTETLKRHLHEKPLKLAIAAGSEDLHSELDEVLGMMWSKAPEDRFQTPKAIIAALSSLVEETPRDVAPIPEEADSPVFDESERPEESSTSDGSDKNTMLGIGGSGPAPSSDEEDDSPTVPAPDTAEDSNVQSGEAAIDGSEPEEPRERKASSDMPSIIIEDPELRGAMSDDEKEEEEEEDNDEREKDDELAETKPPPSTSPNDSEEDDEAEASSDEHDSDERESDEQEAAAADADSDDSSDELPGAAVINPTSIVEDDEADDGEAREEEPKEPQNNPGPASSEDEGPAEEPPAPTLDIDPETMDDAVKEATSSSSDEAVVMGFVDGETGVQHDPDGTATPRSVEAQDSSSKPGAPPIPDQVRDKKSSEKATSEGANEEESTQTGDSESDGDAQVSSADDVDTSNEKGEGDEPDEHDNDGRSRNATDELEAEEIVVLDEGDQAPPSLPGQEEEPQEPDESADSEKADGQDAEEEEDPSVSDGIVVLQEESDPSNESEVQSGENEVSGETEVSGESEVADESRGESNTASGDATAAAASNETDVSGFDPSGEPETDVTNEWFEVSDEEAWMAADVREERDRSEMIRQYATRAVFIILIVAALGLIVFSQFYTPSDDKNNGSSSSQSTSQE